MTWCGGAARRGFGIAKARPHPNTHTHFWESIRTQNRTPCSHLGSPPVKCDATRVRPRAGAPSAHRSHDGRYAQIEKCNHSSVPGVCVDETFEQVVAHQRFRSEVGVRVRLRDDETTRGSVCTLTRDTYLRAHPRVEEATVRNHSEVRRALPHIRQNHGRSRVGLGCVGSGRVECWCA